MKAIATSTSILIICLLMAWRWPTAPPQVAPASHDQDWVLTKDKTVDEVLRHLGDEPLPHLVDTSMKWVSAETGEALVKSGVGQGPGGFHTAQQSKHFVCTSCHNVEKEDPDLAVSDPQARLLYVKDKGLPFLQGTTLYGVVNRTKFYNGDYQKKYGDLVYAARDNIREAIQLCAEECAQGRRLRDWEVESILAYFWKIGLRMEDLVLEEREWVDIQKAIAGNGDKEGVIRLIKRKYLAGSPATFVTPPEDRQVGYKLEGDVENGKMIYDLSCLHCHENGRYAFYRLDDSRFSFRHLDRHFSRYTRYSVYQVARYGTSPLNGKRAYMPNYTLEKMSNQQLEDLRAYVKAMRK